MTRAERAARKAYGKSINKNLLPRGEKEHLSTLFTAYKREFIRGYEQAEKDLGWHSVKESLPEIDEEVIVLTNRVRDIELDSASRICFAHIVDRSLAMDWEGWNIPGVKFWMPMPEIPEEEK